MKAMYSVINSCWIVVMGDRIQSVNKRYFWPALKELKYDLSICGLKLDKNRKVEINGDNPFATQ